MLAGWLLFAPSAHAAQTTGGVHWLDPLSYTKPRFYPITVPDEASCPNKYFVDMTGGAGTTCSLAAPCNDVSTVSGKPGTTGGPAYIYVKGTGRLVLSGTLYGAPGAEIVLKPWSGDSAPVSFTASASGSPGGAAVYLDGAGVHDIIIDGGPDLQFVAHGNGGNDNGYVVNIDASAITVARMEMKQDGGGGPILGAALGAGASISNVRFINNEIHQSNGSTPYGVYVGGGSVCTTDHSQYDHLYFYGNIIRDICGRPIQLEPRNSDTNDTTIVEGNVFHNAGKDPCNSGWGVSAAVGLAGACGASFTHAWVQNNLFFDVSGAFGDGPGDNHYFLDNTVFDYGKGNAQTFSHAVSCYDYTCTATVENNVLLQPNGGVYPVNRGNFSTSHNLCESGSACGNAAVAGTPSGVFVSSDSTNASFLVPKDSSPAIAAGINLYASGVVVDYLGTPRPATAAFTIGAIEYGSATLRPAAPTNLRLIP